MGTAARFRAILNGADRSLPAGALVALLSPLSWLFRLVVALRGLLFDLQLRTAYCADVPVISVGNLTAGGTGKTPFVDYLVKQLLARGRRVAIVSRGYGGTNRQKAAYVSDGKELQLDADAAGDEPLLLARRNATVPVVVSRRRADGLRLLQTRSSVDCVVLDDAFQHRQVHRDLDIVLLDARAPFGNGRLQPAGLLREPASALRRADLVVWTRVPDGATAPELLAQPALVSRHVLDSVCVSLRGEQRTLADFAGQRVLAFAGIAEPESFFSGLRAQGVEPCAELAFADHCAYGADDLARIRETAQGADLLLTTEKDRVKLGASALPAPCYAVGMTMVFDNDSALNQCLDKLFPTETNGDAQ